MMHVDHGRIVTDETNVPRSVFINIKGVYWSFDFDFKNILLVDSLMINLSNSLMAMFWTTGRILFDIRYSTLFWIYHKKHETFTIS